MLLKLIQIKYYILLGAIRMKLGADFPAPKFLVKNDLEVEKILTVDGEKEILRLFLSNLHPGDVVFDIGANIGLFTVPAAQNVGESGRVVAFEPVKQWAERLSQNIYVNNIRNATLCNVGLSASEEVAYIHIKDVLGSGMASIMKNYTEAEKELALSSARIQLVRGDDYLRQENLPFPNVIKIDVEGAEFDVISGLKTTVSDRRCRVLLCEVHPKYLNVPIETFNSLLEECGFDLEKLEPRHSEYHLIARKKE